MSTDTRVVRLLDLDAAADDLGRLLLADDLAEHVRGEYAEAPDASEVEAAIVELVEAGASAWLGLRVEAVDVSALEDYDWSILLAAQIETGGTWVERGVEVAWSEWVVAAMGRHPDSWRGPGAPIPPAAGLTVAGAPADVSSGWSSVRAQVARAVAEGAEERLVRLTRRRHQAEVAFKAAQAEQREAMLAAIDAGLTAYRVSQIAGVTPAAVYKLR